MPTNEARDVQTQVRPRPLASGRGRPAIIATAQSPCHIRFFFEQFRGLLGRYPRLFGGDSEAVAGETFESRWGWHITLDNLSNNDRTKWAFFTDMEVIEFLNELSYRKDKGKWEADKARQAAAQTKAMGVH